MKVMPREPIMASVVSAPSPRPESPGTVLRLVESALEGEDLVRVHEAWCKGCRLCVDHCPRRCLQMEEGVPHLVEPERCTRCGMCEYLCPDFAIQVLKLRWQKG